jgi:mycothiol synthase
VLRSFRDGDQAGWNAVLTLSFERQPGEMDFDRMMAADAAFRPERVKLIVDGDDEVAATASCWLDARFGEHTAMLHYVACHPDHSGQQLGTQVSLAVLHHAIAEGRQRTALFTDDYRIAAIKTYLRMDFEPRIGHRSHPKRWRRILEDLDWPQRFESILD